jgi:hypothetical protein
MSDKRKTFVKRYFKASREDQDGAPIPGTEDVDTWIDVETILGFVTESGTGPSFERRYWYNDQGAAGRTIRWQRIYKDEENDPDSYVQVPIIDGATFVSGTGPGFRRLYVAFNNSPRNKVRKNAVMRVFHAELDNNGNVSVDRDDYIDVDVLEEHVQASGTGPSFRRETWSFDSGEIPARDERLNEKEYQVKERPGSDIYTKWPSYREVAPE